MVGQRGKEQDWAEGEAGQRRNHYKGLSLLQNNTFIHQSLKLETTQNCSSTKSTVVYSHKEYYAAMFLKEQTTVNATTWMTFTDIILIKRNQTLKGDYYYHWVIPFI